MNTKIETFFTNKFYLYFLAINRITSRSLRKIYEFPWSQKTQTANFTEFSEVPRGMSTENGQNMLTSYMSPPKFLKLI